MKILLLLLISVCAHAGSLNLGLAFANICVGSVSPTITCNTTYTRTAQHLQDAMDAANNGDTIYVDPGPPGWRYSQAYAMRGDHSGGTVTISTGWPEFLPCDKCRITPSHLPSVLPLLSSNVIGCATLSGVRDSGGNPPKGWSFVGIAFSVDPEAKWPVLVSNGGTGTSYQCNGDAVSRYYITSASDAPNTITYDRVFAMLRFPDLNYDSSHAFFMDGANIVLKNSFLWPFYGQLNENHGIASLTGPGPLTVTNNFISNGGIPYLAGGSEGDYVNSQPGGWDFRYNFFYRPYKWYPPTWDPEDFSITSLGSPCANPGVGTCYTTANPYPSYYTTNLARHGGTNKIACMKNLGEYKVLDGAIHKYNVHQFQPLDGGGNCLSQYFGQTLTMRGFFNPNPLWWGTPLVFIPGQSKWMDQDPPNGASLSPITGELNNGTLRTSGTSFTWKSPCGDGGPPIPYCGTTAGYPLTYWLRAGNSICIDPSARLIDASYGANVHTFICREITAITSFDVTGVTASTGTLNAPFPSDITIPETTLTLAVNSTTLTIPVASTAGWEPYMVAIVDNEFIQICSVGVSTLSACFDSPPLGPNGRGYCLQDYTTNCAGGRASHSAGATIKRALTWHYNQQNAAKFGDILAENNVYRDVAAPINILAKDRVGSVNTGPRTSRIYNLTFRNALFYDTITNQRKRGPIIRVGTQEQVAFDDPYTSGQKMTFENITVDQTKVTDPNIQPGTALSISADGTPDALAPKLGDFKLRSSLLPDAPYFGIGLVLGDFQNSFANFNSWFSGDSALSYNQLRYVNLGTCAVAGCVGNKNDPFATNVQYMPSTFKLAPTAPASKAGYGGRDMGVNYDQLPLIRDPLVQAGSEAALLTAKLTGPIRDAGNTQPCALEVSANEELQSYIGLAGLNWTLPYTVINALNPGYFKQATDSNRTNSKLLSVVTTPGGYLSWPIGQLGPVGQAAGNVTDDTGVSRNLKLTPNTQYWYRLMCYGDTYHGTFTTAATTVAAPSHAPSFHPPSTIDGVAVADVRLYYGPSTSSMNTMVVQALDVNGDATISIPTTAETMVYYSYAYRSNAGIVLYTSPIQAVFP